MVRRSIAAAKAWRTRWSVKKACGILRLLRSPSTSVQGSVRLRSNVLDAGAREHAKRALPALLFQPLPDVLINLGVPGEIELAGLDHGPGGRGRIPAPFHLDDVEERAVRHVIVRIDLVLRHIPRFEVDDLVRPGADRSEVIRGIAGVLPCVLGEQVLGQNLALRRCTSVELAR